MPLSNTELNRVGNEYVDTDLTVRVHSAAPGANGTTARIGTAIATLDAADWSNAANGDVTYTADAALGALDTTNSQTVTHYSLFRGNAFVGSEEFTAPIVVPANASFTINTGTIQINGATT